MSMSESSTGTPQNSNQQATIVTRSRCVYSARWSPLGLFGALLVALLLVGCGAQRGTVPGGTSQGSDTSGTDAAATATAQPIPVFKLPHTEGAPGCGATASAWYVVSGAGVSCLDNPQRVHLTGEPYGSDSSCCYNEVELPFGSTERLSSTFRIAVDVAGLMGQVHAGDGDLIARLVVRLRPAKGLLGASPVFIVGFSVGGDGSVSYQLALSGSDTAGSLDMTDLARPLSVSITVDAYSAQIALNGATYLQRLITTPVSVAAIALQVVGPAGDSVEYSNFEVDPVTGGVPPMN